MGKQVSPKIIMKSDIETDFLKDFDKLQEFQLELTAAQMMEKSLENCGNL